MKSLLACKLVLLLLIALLLGCSEEDSRAIETLTAQAQQTLVAEGQKQVQTQVAHVQETAIAAAKTAAAQAPSAIETRAAELRETAEAAIKTEAAKRFGRQRKVLIDPGHGRCAEGFFKCEPGYRFDPGNAWNGMLEKDIVLEIAIRTKALLEAQGVTVQLTRMGDVYDCDLSCATPMVEKFAPDIAVSIHTNGACEIAENKCTGQPSQTATGPETWYTEGKPTDKSSYELALGLNNLIAERLGMTNIRGAKSEITSRIECNIGGQPRRCFFIHWWNAPSVIVEIAFQSHNDDALKLRTRQPEFAQAIADGIIDYLQTH